MALDPAMSIGHDSPVADNETSLAFSRYTDDGETEHELEIPFEVIRGGKRFEPKLQLEYDYTQAWHPASGSMIDLTDAEQCEVSELMSEKRAELQALATGEALDAAEDRHAH